MRLSANSRSAALFAPLLPVASVTCMRWYRAALRSLASGSSKRIMLLASFFRRPKPRDCAGKRLPGDCDHACLLLCHPGPCPPCPRTIDARCHCGASTRRRRCGQQSFACGAACGRARPCGHACPAPCHPGECAPCELVAERGCACGSERRRLRCCEGEFRCDQVCGKQLACGRHTCNKVRCAASSRLDNWKGAYVYWDVLLTTKWTWELSIEMISTSIALPCACAMYQAPLDARWKHAAPGPCATALAAIFAPLSSMHTLTHANAWNILMLRRRAMRQAAAGAARSRGAAPALAASRRWRASPAMSGRPRATTRAARRCLAGDTRAGSGATTGPAPPRAASLWRKHAGQNTTLCMWDI